MPLAGSVNAEEAGIQVISSGSPLLAVDSEAASGE